LTTEEKERQQQQYDFVHDFWFLIDCRIKIVKVV